MPGEINCIVTKVLIPFLERTVSPEAGAAICRAAGRSREYLMADHNWLPVTLVNELFRLGQELAGDPDIETFVRRMSEFGMDWKPREERSYLGTYSMGIGSPRSIYPRMGIFYERLVRLARFDAEALGRNSARFRYTPLPGYTMPLWLCRWHQVTMARFPTNWGLPRARVVELQCAAQGADSCLVEVTWKNPPPGPLFWSGTGAGAAVSVALGVATLAGGAAAAIMAAVLLLPLVAGGALGYALRERAQRRHTQRLLDLQSEEILFSNAELETKFRDLDAKIEQLSLLIELSAAVNATLDPEKIYEQALDRLVHRMGFEGAYLFVADADRGVLRSHRIAGTDADQAPVQGLELPMAAEHSVVGKAVATGLPIVVNDVDSTAEPLHRPTVERVRLQALVAVPLRVKTRVFGAIVVRSDRPGRFTGADVDLILAVANHVSLAVDRAESFQTIEDLSRGLEEKVRVRTEQLGAANEELRAAYRELQQTQMQLIQREKMASVGQLVAGVAHELNNPIGFVSSNVATLADFVGRLRAMLDTYRGLGLAEAERALAEDRWRELKVDYALRYLDAMIEGIREGAERARKIVRDLRVFARTGDDVLQAVDLHEELESSLTLLNHLLKDRVRVHRKFGALPSVECVRSQVDQVFLNLLANAAQAIPGEGEITIETRRDGDAVVVTIADTGPGIPPDVIGRIFDPFFTTKPVGEGTGLGLSISYEIVKKHHGEITASSPAGGGAVFTVRLPVTPAR
jgi:signal transduction histidine kinase